MNITLADTTAEFRPWKPDDGQVFKDHFAFDSETTLMNNEHPWITPTYVLGAAFDGQQGYFLTREHTPAFFAAHSNLAVVMHSAAFDLAVLHDLAPQLDIYSWVDRHRTWDTRLLHQLLLLGTEGHTARGKGQSTLEHCAERYVNVALPKDLKDSQVRNVRTSYGEWLGRPASEIEPIYLDYLGKDVIATWLVFEQLWQQLWAMLQDSHDTWGYVSPDWLMAQFHRWGPQTHHIQLKAEIVLRAITANGLGVDLSRRDELIKHLDALLDEIKVRFRAEGYLPGQSGSGKALQEILRHLDRKHPPIPFPRTPTGKYETSREALTELATHEPFVRDLLEYRATEKLRTSFLEKMGRQRLHPSFRTLMVTGRTSSFGEINSQNLPRDDRIRNCFVPAAGHTFLAADYATVEMATLAQAVVSQFNVPSQMAAAINARQDLHRLVAARVTGKPESEVTKEERQKAKPINFGKPGGMGTATLRQSALASYGIAMSDEEVEQLSQTWLELFPEMDHFLRGSETADLGERTARLFGLTPLSYLEVTDSRRYLDHPENAGRESQPHKILGWMCLKVLRDDVPQTQKGEAYAPADIDYFWTMVERHVDRLPADCQTSVSQRTPSVRLRNTVRQIADRAACFTLTGRLRAKASYAARHNTVFQGLAADGAKLALWSLWRAGYRIANFIHDEVLVEIPNEMDLTPHAETIKRLMIEAMQSVVPDVRIDVEYAAADRWSKGAVATLNAEGQLIPWRPDDPPIPTPVPTSSPTLAS